MGLTRSQITQFRKVEEQIKARGIAWLTGGPNGKTKLLHQALEVLAGNDQRLVFTPDGKVAPQGYVSRRRHPEDAAIEYFPRIYFSRQALTPQHVMRQVLTHARIEHGNHTAQVVQAFDSLLLQAAKENRVLSLAVDNAELLPGGAFTILKALNEYHDPRSRRPIGMGVMIAGDTTNKKFWERIPPSFRVRCHEVLMDKIAPEEMPELIEAMHPGQSHYFDRAGLIKLAGLNSLVEMKRAIDASLAERKEYKYSTIGADLVDSKITEVSLLRKAA